MDRLYIVQGSTFIQPIRWGIEPIIYLPIEAIVSLTPLRVQCTGHNIPQGWRAELVSISGMDGLNSTGKNLATDYHYATVVDANTLEFNDIIGTNYSAYKSGGFVKCWTPMSLDDHEAVLTIWDKVNGTELLTLTSTDGDITIDVAGYRITVEMTAAATAALTWKKGVFGLDMIHTPTGKSTKIASGPVVVEIE